VKPPVPTNTLYDGVVTRPVGAMTTADLDRGDEWPERSTSSARPEESRTAAIGIVRAPSSAPAMCKGQGPPTINHIAFAGATLQVRREAQTPVRGGGGDTPARTSQLSTQGAANAWRNVVTATVDPRCFRERAANYIVETSDGTDVAHWHWCGQRVPGAPRFAYPANPSAERAKPIKRNEQEEAPLKRRKLSRRCVLKGSLRALRKPCSPSRPRPRRRGEAHQPQLLEASPKEARVVLIRRPAGAAKARHS